MDSKIWQATFTYVAISGLGGSIIFAPSVGILPSYFDKRKAFAVSFAQSDAWIGNLVFVTASSSIRESYNWRI